MVVAKFSCKDCKNRYVGCHSTCEKYIKEKEAANAIAKKVNTKKQLYANHKMEKPLSNRMRKH